ncbi:MAG: hypothetical protein KBA66_16365 [Leptospiraceae bacterium]|nr:hypothetical protein [Leptospiraceae bacterium]
MKIYFLFILLLSSIPLFSETLVLKDGTVIKMSLKAQDANTLTYTLKGKDFTIPKSKVRRVVFAKTPEIEEKIAKEEIQKLRQEKSAKKVTKTQEEEQEENRLLDEEIAKAIEEQKKQELLNLSFEERIRRLENEVSSINVATGGNTSKKIMEIEKELKDLQKRTRRIERFLEIDPDLEDYYSKPRSMWSIVWRSALIPGWGLSYGRSEGFSTMYTSMFFISALGGAGYKSSLSGMEKTLNDTLINELVVKPFALSTLAGNISTSTTITNDVANYQSYNTTIRLVKYMQSRDTFNQQVENSEKVITFAVGIYAIQLIHSAIYGYFWEKKIPKSFSEEKASGWKIQISPLARKNQITNTQDYQMELGYRFEF